MAEPGLTVPGAIQPDRADPDVLRLFFALWPDDATRDALDDTGQRLHQQWRGRRMRADTLHLTLAFLGATPVTQLQALISRVEAIQARAFTLVLDQPGYWHHNRVGWLGPTRSPDQLGELVSMLNGAIVEAGVNFDPRPHRPHVTLVRDAVGGALPPCGGVRWEVRDFVLVASCLGADGPCYDLLGRWPLNSQAG